jgi:hypothetical protein
VADPVTRSAARLAVLVAVPVAVLAGVGVFGLLSGALDRDRDPDLDPGAGPTPAATGPVEMAAPELTARAEVVCRGLLSQLPTDQLDGLGHRPVTAGPEQNAAYGDPPVTVACGVPPADHPPTAELLLISGVCWYPAQAPDGTVWTTLDREVPVRVTVPDGYAGPGQRVVPVSAVIGETIRPAEDAPSGCRG